MSVAAPARTLRPRRAVLLESAVNLNAQAMADANSDEAQRSKPNILITGTPGTGKTTHADLVASEAGLQHLNISELVKLHDLHDGWDEEANAFNMNDDKVNDHLESLMEEGGVVVDHHSSEFFPERFFDLVVVLQTDNTVLYDRLKARDYAERKIHENVQCEIMHVPCEEAQSAYREEVVQVLQSDEMDELERNVETIVAWVAQYCGARGGAA